MVIDCGHGGHDEGAHGHFNIKEKDITLIIGKEVAHLLSKQNIDVICTRVDDTYLALDERTAIANTYNADVFLSIHTNFSNKEQACGIETFFLDDRLFQNRVMQVDTDIREHKKYESMIHALFEQRSMQSKALAQALQHHVLIYAHKKQQVVDRKVKSAVTQVLLGAMLPAAALIEVGFLSNAKEAALLNSSSYRTLIAEGIAAGICAYLHRLNDHTC